MVRANRSVGRPNRTSFLRLTGALPTAGALRSSLQMYEMTGANGVKEMRLRGYVVRLEVGAEGGTTGVGVVFTD